MIIFHTKHKNYATIKPKNVLITAVMATGGQMGTRKILIILSIMLCFSFASLVSVSAADNDPVVDEVNLTVPVSCSLSGTGMDSHVTTLQNGHSNSTIGESTITAYCNDINGFSIYAIGYTNDEYGNTFLIDSNLASTNNIPTGTATSGDTSNWAMKLTPVTSPTPTYPITITGSADDADKTSTTLDYTTFQSIPAEYALVAKRKAATDVGTNAEGSSFKTTYQAYAASGQAAGTYTGQVKYTLIHPYDAEAPLSPQTTASGKICYYPNGSNVEGTMGCQTIPTSGTTDGVSPTSATLLASNFSRTGYGFAGWSNKFDYATNPNQEGIKFYGPQETITYENGQYVGEGKGLSLYAVWVKSVGNLQDTTKVAGLCGMGTGSLIKANEATNILSQSITALSDARDNNTYAIAKLADGKCWMIENLRLDNSASLTLANTNNPLNDGTNVTLKHSYSDTETHNTLSASQDPTATAWCQSNDASCDDQSMLFTGNTTNRASSPTANGVAMYSYGNYYNWYSATAGRGKYSFSTNNNSVAGDLCPAGWHLPKGGNKSNEANNEFWSLVVTGINGGTNPANYESSTQPYYTGTPEGTEASNKLRAYPNNFVYSGVVVGGSVIDRGSYGLFWSSMAYSSSTVYYLGLGSSYVNPGALNNLKYSGWPVRCVAGS